MDKNIFGEQLKAYRVSHDMSQEQLASRLGTSKQVISRYESGLRTPKISVLAEYAKKLDLDVHYFLSETYDRAPAGSTVAITPLSGRHAELNHIDDALNTAGHEQFVQYGEYLTARPEYQQNGEVYEAPVSYIREYLTPPAAGYAAPIEGSDYVDVPRDNLTPPTADFCVRVSGDSMEPHIKDGQRIYVRRDVVLEDFDVGVFFYDGQVFVKQYCPSYDGSVYLMSANPKREDANIFISRNSSSTLICFGKVLLGHKLPMPSYK